MQAWTTMPLDDGRGEPQHMPTYEYACKSCGEHLEVVQSFQDDSLTTCPACGGPLRKVFGNIGIAFKGSGFYKNDSRAKVTSSASASPESGGGDKGSGDKAGGEKSGGDKPTSDKPTPDKGSGDKGSGDKGSGDKGGGDRGGSDKKSTTKSNDGKHGGTQAGGASNPKPAAAAS